MIKPRKIAELLDGAFLIASLVIAFRALFDGYLMLAALWFTAHGVWCCSGTLIKIYEHISGKKHD